MITRTALRRYWQRLPRLVRLAAAPVLFGAAVALLVGQLSAGSSNASPATLSDVHACQLLRTDLAASNPDSIRLMGDSAVAVSSSLKQAITDFIEARGLTAGTPYSQDGYDGMTRAAAVISTFCNAVGVPGAADGWAN